MTMTEIFKSFIVMHVI